MIYRVVRRCVIFETVYVDADGQSAAELIGEKTPHVHESEYNEISLVSVGPCETFPPGIVPVER